MTDEPSRRDYRTSHLDEGPDYHAKFEQHALRALLWELEREILLDVLERRFPEPGSVSVLDFACGTGRILSVLEGRVAEAVGVDVSESMLAVAKQVLARSKLLCCDLTREPALEGRRYDLVTAFRFFPNADPVLRDEAMARLRSLLAPGGVLVYNNHLRCGSASQRFEGWLRAVGLRRKKKRRHCMSDAEMNHLAAAHGLRVLESHYIGVLPVLKERRPLLGKRLTRRIERAARRWPVLRGLASSRIDVCEASPATA
jgi:SAM-dependent methyltransferase